MGLSSAIAGGIVMVTMVYVLLVMPSVVDKSSTVQDAVSEISKVEKIIDNTNISFSSISPSIGSNVFQGTLSNFGTQKLWNFVKFDFIITYNSTSSGKLTQSLTYSGLCGGTNPAAGNWCVDSISNDYLDPNIFNENESMVVKGTTSQNANTGLVIMTFSTDHGVVTTRSTTLT